MTITVDRNEAFASERAAIQRNWEARIASGELRKNSDGSYTVTQGWDAGERISAQGVPMTQLDMSTGNAALYSAVPAWHSLGNVVPGGLRGIATVPQVLKLGFIDWTVDLVPTMYPWLDGSIATLQESFVTRRSDTGQGLATVGKVYEPIQNQDAFDFLQELVGRYDCVWESAGALREGRKVFVTMRLPEPIVIDPNGAADEIVPFIAAINSHDGSSNFTVVTTPWRILCGNTERFAIRDAVTAWKVRHTKNALTKLEQARQTLGLAENYYARFAAEETKLAQTAATLDDMDDLIKSLWPEPDAATSKTTRGNTIWHNRRDSIMGLFQSGPNNENIRGTLYAAERSVTEYLDNVAPMRPRGSLRGDITAARGQAVLEGTNDDKKSEAHKLLMVRAGA